MAVRDSVRGLLGKLRSPSSEAIPGTERQQAPIEFAAPIPTKKRTFRGSENEFYPKSAALDEAMRLLSHEDVPAFLEAVQFSPRKEPYCKIADGDWHDIARFALSLRKAYCTKYEDIRIYFPDRGNTQTDQKVLLVSNQNVLIKNQKHPDPQRTGKTFGYEMGLCAVDNTLYVTTGMFDGNYVLIARPLCLENEEEKRALLALLS